MRKVALVFTLAVFVPSLVLAWLAFRSLRDQQFALERQQALLYQGVAEALVKEANDFVTERRREFHERVEALISQKTLSEVVGHFNEQLRESWPVAEVGFVVARDGRIMSPSMLGSPEGRRFLLENDRFLCNAEPVEVFWKSPKGPINLTRLDQSKEEARKAEALKAGGASGGPEALVGNDYSEKSVYATKQGKGPAYAPPTSSGGAGGQPEGAAEEAQFRQLVGDATEGTLSRFLQNKLKVLFWYRSPRDPQLVFGAQVSLSRFTAALVRLIRVEPPLDQEICVALLDDGFKPLAVSRPGFTTDWRRPFVTAEMGEVLPHWEVAVYLLNPAQFGQTAQTLRLTLGFLIGLLVLAIGIGSWLIVTDLKRQITWARQKTDFVSNVSHELKTPLTSIRMFSELLAEGRVQDSGKQRQYLAVITAETARLTRLINNVLDFARIERGEKSFRFQPCDLAVLVEETVEAYRPHLEASGFQFRHTSFSAPIMVSGDRDALAQVLVNLLSNAEKYCGERREITVETEQRGGLVAVRVLDRGMGVPGGAEQKIFEQFYRAHDSLASGIQGSGLGLTLARQIARAHGGDVLYQSRAEGGSCFILQLPASAGTKA